ncbi:hypothetical protein AAMO2058_001015000 [Amorphochlora amoebiformis]
MVGTAVWLVGVFLLVVKALKEDIKQENTFPHFQTASVSESDVIKSNLPDGAIPTIDEESRRSLPKHMPGVPGEGPTRLKFKPNPRNLTERLDNYKQYQVFRPKEEMKALRESWGRRMKNKQQNQQTKTNKYDTRSLDYSKWDSLTVSISPKTLSDEEQEPHKMGQDLTDPDPSDLDFVQGDWVFINKTDPLPISVRGRAVAGVRKYGTIEGLYTRKSTGKLWLAGYWLDRERSEVDLLRWRRGKLHSGLTNLHNGVWIRRNSRQFKLKSDQEEKLKKVVWPSCNAKEEKVEDPARPSPLLPMSEMDKRIQQHMHTGAKVYRRTPDRKGWARVAMPTDEEERSRSVSPERKGAIPITAGFDNDVD